MESPLDDLEIQFTGGDTKKKWHIDPDILTISVVSIFLFILGGIFWAAALGGGGASSLNAKTPSQLSSFEKMSQGQKEVAGATAQGKNGPPAPSGKAKTPTKIPTPTSVPSSTPSPTPIPSPTATPNPTSTPTPTPTATSTPSPTPTNTPTPTPSS